MSLKDDLLKFVREDLVGSNDPNAIDENEPLIDSGYIDSMGLMQLTTFIEERTGVRIPDDEVVPDNFQTVASIEQLITRLKARS
jgi:acyl carrier protein